MNANIKQLYIYIDVSKMFSKHKKSKITFPRFETFRFNVSVSVSMQPSTGSLCFYELCYFPCKKTSNQAEKPFLRWATFPFSGLLLVQHFYWLITCYYDFIP